MASFTMNDLIHCSICLEKFQQPRALPCLHTFCQICLQELITMCARNGNISSGFECPVCRREALPRVTGGQELGPHEQWASLFPINHLIMTLLDEHRGRPTAGSHYSNDEPRRSTELASTHEPPDYMSTEEDEPDDSFYIPSPPRHFGLHNQAPGHYQPPEDDWWPPSPPEGQVSPSPPNNYGTETNNPNTTESTSTHELPDYMSTEEDEPDDSGFITPPHRHLGPQHQPHGHYPPPEDEWWPPPSPPEGQMSPSPPYQNETETNDLPITTEPQCSTDLTSSDEPPDDTTSEPVKPDDSACIPSPHSHFGPHYQPLGHYPPHQDHWWPPPPHPESQMRAPPPFHYVPGWGLHAHPHGHWGPDHGFTYPPPQYGPLNHHPPPHHGFLNHHPSPYHMPLHNHPSQQQGLLHHHPSSHHGPLHHHPIGHWRRPGGRCHGGRGRGREGW